MPNRFSARYPYPPPPGLSTPPAPPYYMESMSLLFWLRFSEIWQGWVRATVCNMTAHVLLHWLFRLLGPEFDPSGNFETSRLRATYTINTVTTFYTVIPSVLAFAGSYALRHAQCGEVHGFGPADELRMSLIPAVFKIPRVRMALGHTWAVVVCMIAAWMVASPTRKALDPFHAGAMAVLGRALWVMSHWPFEEAKERSVEDCEAGRV